MHRLGLCVGSCEVRALDGTEMGLCSLRTGWPGERAWWQVDSCTPSAWYCCAMVALLGLCVSQWALLGGATGTLFFSNAAWRSWGGEPTDQQVSSFLQCCFATSPAHPLQGQGGDASLGASSPARLCQVPNHTGLPLCFFRVSTSCAWSELSYCAAPVLPPGTTPRQLEETGRAWRPPHAWPQDCWPQGSPGLSQISATMDQPLRIHPVPARGPDSACSGPAHLAGGSAGTAAMQSTVCNARSLSCMNRLKLQLLPTPSSGRWTSAPSMSRATPSVPSPQDAASVPQTTLRLACLTRLSHLAPHGGSWGPAEAEQPWGWWRTCSACMTLRERQLLAWRSEGGRPCPCSSAPHPLMSEMSWFLKESSAFREIH